MAVQTQITANDVRGLNESEALEPVLVRWENGTFGVQPAILLRTADEEYEAIISRSDLRSQGEWDPDNATDADYEAWADYLNQA